MDIKTDKATLDFMNVEQLPYIRPPPKEKGIRLFGKELGGAGPGEATKTTESCSIETISIEKVKDQENGESKRRFECQYCCRNFATSQALGGHQNAHKRERRHAKKEHFHSNLSDSNLYSYMNHRPLTYPSWDSISSTVNVASNCSPLGLWERSWPSYPQLVGDELRRSQVGGSSAQSRYVYDQSTTYLHEHVSLDLHL